MKLCLQVNKKIIIYTLLCVVIVLLLLPVKFVYKLEDDDFHNVYIDVSKIIFETDDKFVSIAIDTSFVKHTFPRLNDTGWETLKNLTSFLAPAYLRLGGTAADQFWFQETKLKENFLNKMPVMNLEGTASDEQSPTDYLLVSSSDWLKIIDFVKKTKVKFLFDVNVLLRNGTEWDDTNAKLLMKFSSNQNFKMDFQLGNEPNSFRHVFNVTISAKQLGKDFKKLHKLMSSYKLYNQSLLIGPDVTRPKEMNLPSLEYLKDFLSVGESSINAVSWHQYYFNGRTAAPKDFIGPSTFGQLAAQISSIKNIVHSFKRNLPIWLSTLDLLTSPFQKKSNAPMHCATGLHLGFKKLSPMTEDSSADELVKEIVLDKEMSLTMWKESFHKKCYSGETSSAYGGGAPGLSDRFIASFLWLDKLGLAAKMGISVVIRQTLFQGHYALIDSDFQPLPDFWISIFYKRLVGSQVLNVYVNTANMGEEIFDKDKIRLYAHCTKRCNSTAAMQSAITLYGMNLDNSTQYLRVHGLKDQGSVRLYVFAPENDDLLSKKVLLNGQPLNFDREDLENTNDYAKILEWNSYIILPPFSITFWVIYDAGENICTNIT